MFDCLVKEPTKLDQLLGIANELDDWEYQFVMGIAEREYISENQAVVIDKMVYDKIEAYL